MKIVTTLLLSLFASSVLFAQSGKTVQVQTRANSTVENWTPYEAHTVDNLKGFKKKKEPALSVFGGYKTNRQEATGFFRTEKINGRWWIIDPEGYPFHHRAVVAFGPGTSKKQQSAFQEKFGTRAQWVKAETEMLRSYGFNGAGAWSAVEDIRTSQAPLVYTLIVNPMGNYKHEHVKKYGGTYRWPAGRGIDSICLWYSMMSLTNM